MIRNISKQNWTRIGLFVFLLVAAYFILPVSIPLVVALLTALCLNPLIKLTEKKLKVKRKNAVIIVFFLFLFIMGLAGTFLITKATLQVIQFIEDIPAYIREVNAMYQNLEHHIQQYAKHLPPEFVKEVTDSLQNSLSSFSETVKDKLTIDKIAQFTGKIPQYLISFLVYLIALFLFMLELPLLKKKTYGLLTSTTAEKVSFMNARLSDVIIGFFKAQFLVSIIIFLVSLVGLFLIVPQAAIIMSIIIWVVDVIPIIGSIIILGPWALFMFLSGQTTMGIQLSILAIVLLAIRRTVEPKVMGKHIGLSPLATLIAMFLGLKLLGIFGFILGPLVLIAFNSAKEAEIIKWNVKI